MLMPNCSTVSAILAPSCAASMTRLRKSSEYGFAIRTGLHSSTILESDSPQKGNRPDSTFSENALADVAKRDTEPGPGLTCSLTTCFPGRASSTLGPNSDLPSFTRGRSRMRESRTYGSVRGAGSDLRPYRDRPRRCSNSAAIWENTGRDSNVIAKAALNPKVTAVRLHPGLHIGGADHLG